MTIRSRLGKLEQRAGKRPCGDPFHAPGSTARPLDYRAGLEVMRPADDGGRQRIGVQPAERCPSCGQGSPAIEIRAVDTGSETYWAELSRPAGAVGIKPIDYREVCRPLYSDEQQEDTAS